MDRLSRYYFKFFKGCLPQILLGPFLSTLSHLLFIMIICKLLLQWSSIFQLSNITHNLSLIIFGNLHSKQAAAGHILLKKVFLENP